jgi:hypothetical protein
MFQSIHLKPRVRVSCFPCLLMPETAINDGFRPSGTSLVISHSLRNPSRRSLNVRCPVGELT